MTTYDESPPRCETRAGRRAWLGLGLLVLPMLVLATDLTVLFLAMPTIGVALEPTPTESLWIVHAYGFLVAGFLVTMGRVSDRVGPRRLLLVGSGLFAILSAVAAFAPSAPALIVVRALMGVAGATLMPSLFSLLRVMFRDDDQRRLAIAVMFSAFTAGGALGPLIGGVLLEHFRWGSVFLVNVPVLLLFLAAGPALLPESPGRAAAGIDLPSVLLSVAGMLAVVWGLQELAAGHGGRTVAPIAVAVTGVLLLALFGRRQRRLEVPLLDLALLTDRRIGTSLLALLLTGIGVVGLFYLFTQFLQWVVGLSPLQAGLWTLPYIVVNIAGALLAPRLAARASSPAVVARGLLLAAVGAAAVTVLVDRPLVVVIAALSVIGLGHGMAMALVSDMIISGAPAEQAGSAAAVQEVGGELGAALGIALAGTVALAVVGDASGGAAQVARVAAADGLQVYAVVAAVLVLTAAALVVVRRPPEAAR